MKKVRCQFWYRCKAQNCEAKKDHDISFEEGRKCTSLTYCTFKHGLAKCIARRTK
jgi:hypothetical protein